MRGLRTILVEQSDFASGTSSRSSRLLHGGFRYLAQGHIGLVREASHEKMRLSNLAPHLCHPLPFYFPVWNGRPGRNGSSRSASSLRPALWRPQSGHLRPTDAQRDAGASAWPARATACAAASATSMASPTTRAWSSIRSNRPRRPAPRCRTMSGSLGRARRSRVDVHRPRGSIRTGSVDPRRRRRQRHRRMGAKASATAPCGCG